MEYKALKDIAKITMGQSPDSSSYNEDGEGIPFFQGNADFGETYPTERIWCNDPKKTAEPGDILISVRAPIGALNYAKDKCCIGRGLAAITIEDEAERNYVFHLLKAKNSDLNNKGTGSTFKAIGKSVLEDVQVPQISRDEQQKCMDMMDLLESIIRERKAQLASLDELIKARFVELFGDLMENPLGWPVMTIADVSTFLKSGLSRKLSDDDIGLPVIRSGNIQDGQFIFDDVKYWYIDDPQGANTKDYILNDGDVLVNFINSSSQIGKTAIYRDTGRDCIYTTNIFRMKLADNCNEYYYNWFAKSDYYYRHLQSIIQPAVNQASFTTVNFLKLPIPLPPKEKQGEFADFVKQVDKSKVAVQKALKETQTLFNSLMQEYFG